MGQEENIGELRSRMSALVEQEAVLLTQAFDLSRDEAERRSVDALFARVQAIQLERNSLKKKIAGILGTQRLHEASEVWKPGVYEYCRQVGTDCVRVQITRGALGLQVHIPGRKDPLRIEALEGTFEGPLAVDDDATHAAPSHGLADAPKEEAVGNGKARKARGRKNPP